MGSKSSKRDPPRNQCHRKTIIMQQHSSPLTLCNRCQAEDYKQHSNPLTLYSLPFFNKKIAKWFWFASIPYNTILRRFIVTLSSSNYCLHRGEEFENVLYHHLKKKYQRKEFHTKSNISHNDFKDQGWCDMGYDGSRKGSYTYFQLQINRRSSSSNAIWRLMKE